MKNILLILSNILNLVKYDIQNKCWNKIIDFKNIKEKIRIKISIIRDFIIKINKEKITKVIILFKKIKNLILYKDLYIYIYKYQFKYYLEPK